MKIILRVRIIWHYGIVQAIRYVSMTAFALVMLYAQSGYVMIPPQANYYQMQPPIRHGSAALPFPNVRFDVILFNNSDSIIL